MHGSDEYTLHRKRLEAAEDKVIATGSKSEMLRQFGNLPEAQRVQYFLMQGGMEWNHLEIEGMLREKD